MADGTDGTVWVWCLDGWWFTFLYCTIHSQRIALKRVSMTHHRVEFVSISHPRGIIIAIIILITIVLAENGKLGFL